MTEAIRTSRKDYSKHGKCLVLTLASPGPEPMGDISNESFPLKQSPSAEPRQPLPAVRLDIQMKPVYHL